MLAYTPEDELIEPEEDQVQTIELEREANIQKPPEVERSKRCFIYLMDIRDTALFDKYLKRPSNPPNESMTPAPADELLENIEDRSPIEVPDSDEELDNNNNSSSSSVDDTNVIEISDSE